jgi:peptide/nickel transport system substrate-binding protein
MKRTIILLVIAAVLLTPFTVLAQEPAEPGSGGPIIQGNAGTGVGPLNYLRCDASDCFDVDSFLVVGSVGVDPEAQNYAPGVWDGVLFTDWTVSDDGLTYTYNLRDDLVWSDGEPVDGWDYLFNYYAYKHADEFESPYSYAVADIDNVEYLPDQNQVKVTMATAACNSFSQMAINMVPSHVFGWEPDMGEDFDWSSLIEHPFETNPDVSGGIFVFDSMDSDRVVLTTNFNYVDGPVIPEGWLYVTVPDQTVLAERFMAGELNIIESVQESQRESVRADENLQYFEYPGNSWDFLGLNLANPDNPMNGVELDEEGNPVLDENGLAVPVEQDPHPIFGDVRVRRAIQMAIDLDEIMQKAVFGEGDVMASYDITTSWARDPNLEPIGRDVEGALALLEEAGWTDSNGDGILDKDGMDFEFELLTNQGNTRREQIGELVQDQLGEIGIVVNYSAIEWNTLLEIADAQTFDAMIMGWGNAFPVDPDPQWAFIPSSDIVGSGFNFVSYVNPEIERLALEALNVPGCDPAARAEIYGQIQRILQDDQAYVWLFTRRGFYGANATVGNWEPAPNLLFNNADEWMIAK